jgi:hypothetical protein
MTPDDPVLATISASALRRTIGVACLAGLGVLLVWLAADQPYSPPWRLVLLVFAGAVLWAAWRMYHATSRVVELTRRELRDSAGTLIARVADVEAVDRGFFAFKPSNGFLLRTREPAGPDAWHPGLWWRAGRRIGIGGMTPGAQTRVAADILAAMLAERDRGV